jgi:hypothetical protein
MGMALGAEKFQGQEAPQGVGGRDHLGARQIAPANHPVERHRRQRRQEPAELGAEGPRFQAQCPHVGRIGGGGLGARGAFIVLASRQPGKTLLLQHCRNGYRRALDSVLLQGLADIVDRLVLLAQAND